MAAWNQIVLSGSNANLNFLGIGNNVKSEDVSSIKLYVSGNGLFTTTTGNVSAFVENSNVIGSISAIEDGGVFIMSEPKSAGSQDSIGFLIDNHLSLYITGSTKNVGINTDDPTHKLRVSGSLRVDSPGSSPGTAPVGPPDNVEGGDAATSTPNIFLGTPDKWLTINIDGVDYQFPGYRLS